MFYILTVVIWRYRHFDFKKNPRSGEFKLTLHNNHDIIYKKSFPWFEERPLIEGFFITIFFPLKCRKSLYWGKIARTRKFGTSRDNDPNWHVYILLSLKQVHHFYILSLSFKIHHFQHKLKAHIWKTQSFFRKKKDSKKLSFALKFVALFYIYVFFTPLYQKSLSIFLS